MRATDPLKHLKVIAYDAESMGRQIPEDDNRWFAAEACGRHVLVSLDPTAEIPSIIKNAHSKAPLHSIKHRRAARFFEGEDAYAFLLMVATGLLDQDQGNEAALTAMKVNFDAMQTRQREKGCTPSPEVNSLIRNILFDAGLIIKNVLRDSQGAMKVIHHSQEPAAIFRRLLPTRIPPTEKMLLIGEKDHVTGTTFEVLSRRYKHIDIINPDLNQLRENIAHCRNLNADKKLGVEIGSPSAELTVEALGQYSSIVVCSAMDACPEFEATLREAWLAQPDHITNRLVHLRGVPQQRGKTSDSWQACRERTGFIDREMLDVENAKHKAQSNQTVDQAFNACHNCAFSRKNNGRHVLKDIAVSPEGYREAYLQSCGSRAERVLKEGRLTPVARGAANSQGSAHEIS